MTKISNTGPKPIATENIQDTSKSNEAAQTSTP